MPLQLAKFLIHNFWTPCTYSNTGHSVGLVSWWITGLTGFWSTTTGSTPSTTWSSLSGQLKDTFGQVFKLRVFHKLAFMSNFLWKETAHKRENLYKPPILSLPQPVFSLFLDNFLMIFDRKVIEKKTEEKLQFFFQGKTCKGWLESWHDSALRRCHKVKLVYS